MAYPGPSRRRRGLIALIVVLLTAILAVGVYLAVRPSGVSGPGAFPSQIAPSVIPTQGPTVKPSKSNPFGLVGTRTIDLGVQLEVSKHLGMRYFRTLAAVIGSDVSFAQDTKAIHDAGLEIVLDVRNFPVDPFPLTGGLPTEEFPTDMAAYKAGIAKAIVQAKPVLITIGNESNLPTSFSGTPQDYQQMLQAGCEVAHEHGIKCATDGMLSSSTQLTTYYYYAFVKNDPQTADQFMRDAFDSRLAAIPPEMIRQRVEQYFAPFMDAYKAAQPDFVNFHWYSQPGSDPAVNAGAFALTVKAFSAWVGVPAITNETGVRDDNAEMVTCRMAEAVELKMKYVIFYNSDAGLAGPRALMEASGALRPQGSAFAAANMALDQGKTLAAC
jgi:hypothetical protein